MKLVSPCCRAEVRPHVEKLDELPWRTNWYECKRCGKPCDPVEKQEEA